MRRFARFVLYTLLWCLFPPFFLINNRGLQAGYAFLPRGTARRIGRLLRQGNLLLATELFWGRWNPGITFETTRPLYQFCGGNRNQIFATSVCFLYSGIFLHWGGIGLMWLRFYELYTGGWNGLTSLVTIGMYAFMGLLVILSKIVRMIKTQFKRRKRTRLLSY